MKSFELNRKVAMFPIFGASLVAAYAASRGGVVLVTGVAVPVDGGYSCQG